MTTVATDEQMLERINDARAVLGEPPFKQLPRAKPADGTCCLFGRSLRPITVTYDNCTDFEHAEVAIFNLTESGLLGEDHHRLARALGGQLTADGEFVRVTMDDPVMQLMLAFDTWQRLDLVTEAALEDECPLPTSEVDAELERRATVTP